MKRVISGLSILMMLVFAMSMGIADEFIPEEPSEFIEVPRSKVFENATRIEVGKFYGVTQEGKSDESEFVFTAKESGVHYFYFRSVSGDNYMSFEITDQYANKLCDKINYYNYGKNPYVPMITEIELTAGKEYHLRKKGGVLSSGYTFIYVFAVCSPSQHVGPLTATRVVKEPTCTEPGIQAQCCALCGGETNRTTINAHGHTPGELQVFEEATCLADGEQGTTCSECGEILTRSIIPKVEHTPAAWVEIRPATCTGAGVRVQYCAFCGETLKTETVEPLGHSFSEWTDNQSHYCIYCGYTEYRENPTK